MTEEEKEVIRMIKTGLEVKVEGTQIETIILKRKSAEIVLNLIQKQEKIIDKMAEQLSIAQDRYEYMTPEEVIKSVERQVEENE